MTNPNEKESMTITNPTLIRLLKDDPRLTSAELYPTDSDGHKFKPGDVCTLTGLKDFPEHNGQDVKVTAIRQSGPHGKAYYVEGALNKLANWVYEYRLKAKATRGQP